MSNDQETRRGEILTEVRGGVGWVTIARPEKRNALTVSMWEAIAVAMRGLAARDEVAAIMLQGADGVFGAGADLDDVVAATAGPAEALEYCTLVVTALLAVATTPVPTVALVEGVAAGGAAELALACDVRIADPASSFAFPFARLGVVPDRFTLERLAALVGPGAARRLVFTGESVDAGAALRLRLVDEVTEAGGVASAADRWAESLRRGSRAARVGMKRILSGRETSYEVAELTREMMQSFVGGEVRAAALRFLEGRVSGA